jgi:hypothetical protein
MSWELTLTAAVTLAIYSFLVGDNPVYRFVEHLLVGLTIGYSLVLTVRSVIVPQAVVPLIGGQWGALVPLLLGGAMFLRFSRRLGGWSQIPLAIIVGAGAGVALPAMLKARVLTQIAATISGSTDANGLIILGGVAATLAYFVFTRFHRGAWGGIAGAGRYFMMVFFGATFAYTVMSRMALLIGRLEFLLGDWLRVL